MFISYDVFLFNKTMIICFLYFIGTNYYYLIATIYVFYIIWKANVHYFFKHKIFYNYPITRLILIVSDSPK